MIKPMVFKPNLSEKRVKKIRNVLSVLISTCLLSIGYALWNTKTLGTFSTFSAVVSFLTLILFAGVFMKKGIVNMWIFFSAPAIICVGLLLANVFFNERQSSYTNALGVLVAVVFVCLWLFGKPNTKKENEKRSSEF